ncbi:hypothetical protein GOBAR_DD05222 [Gossypium barbadense]|nr:hypothetical protein GOBAR_DD05222 [Gossypium barbadense]
MAGDRRSATKSLIRAFEAYSERLNFEKGSRGENKVFGPLSSPNPTMAMDHHWPVQGPIQFFFTKKIEEEVQNGSCGLTRVEGQRLQCQRRALKVPGGWGWQTRRPPEACGS